MLLDNVLIHVIGSTDVCNCVNMTLFVRFLYYFAHIFMCVGLCVDDAFEFIIVVVFFTPLGGGTCLETRLISSSSSSSSSNFKLCIFSFV